MHRVRCAPSHHELGLRYVARKLTISQVIVIRLHWTWSPNRLLIGEMSVVLVDFLQRCIDIDVADY